MEATYLPGRKRAPRQLGRVLVLGLGKSGKAVLDYLQGPAAERVGALAVAAGQESPEARSYVEAHAAAETLVAFGDEAVGALAERVAEQVGGSAPCGDGAAFDLCVASPGIPPHSPLYRAAEAVSAEVVSEVELAWRESAADAVWVAITGTNGKTTTTALTAHLLREAGLAADAVGNIGDACIQAVAAGRTRAYVAEVSSYQLASTRAFAPDVAVMLNITPDHLSWHGSHEAYVQATERVLANPKGVPGAVAVLDATNDTVRALVRRLKAMPDAERGFSYVPIGTADGLGCDMRVACGSANAAFLDEGAPGGGVLRVALGGAEHGLGSADELPLKGAHNVGNALAAATAALAAGASPEALRAGLRSFAPLEHRIEPAGKVGTVECYNDSKATNVDAVLVALRAFVPRKPVVLLGGRDKGTDLAPLVGACEANAAAVVLFGESLPRFSEAFEGASLPVLRASHLADALDVALETAQPDGIVLLSPACASFDEFGSFEERGRAFKALVADRAAGR